MYAVQKIVNISEWKKLLRLFLPLMVQMPIPVCAAMEYLAMRGRCCTGLPVHHTGYLLEHNQGSTFRNCLAGLLGALVRQWKVAARQLQPIGYDATCVFACSCRHLQHLYVLKTLTQKTDASRAY